MKTETIKAVSFIDNPNEKYIRIDIENNPVDFLKEKLSSKFSFGVDNIISNGYYKEMGYVYNLRNFLKKYLVKKYGNWQEMYAINKTNARKLTIGKIEKIIEIQ